MDPSVEVLVSRNLRESKTPSNLRISKESGRSVNNKGNIGVSG